MSVPDGGQPPYPPPYPPAYPAPYGRPAKSKTAAGLLSIFLGCFGAGNFYLGHMGKGIAQVVATILSLGTISFIWGVVEGILILTAQPGSPWAFDAAGRPLAS
ncbi:MAG: TM2 domain-containing protein [Bifidobacteriaceae bacterium]|nr:TM2 domain-containing protein [Bifidobacteriaceae bacterium]